MRLFELEGTDPIVTRLVALTDQLKTDLENKEVGDDFTVDQLLKYFSKYDIVLDKSDLYNMIEKPPLKNIISNIKGDRVIFKGTEDTTEVPKDQSEKIVSQMAKKAAKIK